MKIIKNAVKTIPSSSAIVLHRHVVSEAETGGKTAINLKECLRRFETSLF